MGTTITNLQDPVFSLPNRPARQYYSPDRTVTTDWATVGTKNVAVMNDFNYAIETGEYSRKISCYEIQLKVWGDTNAKGYTLVLNHCPEELQAELKNQEVWVAINNVRSVVRLLPD